MIRAFQVALVASLTLLAACGGKGDDSLGDNVADAYDNRADTLDAAADNAATPAQGEALENQADATRDLGKAKEEAIDDADVNAAAVSPEAKNAMMPQ